MSKLAKAKEKAKNLEARDPKGAIESWLDALRAQEEEGEANPDLTIYNRVGDLYLKLKDAGQAADYYERAVDKYAELGFHNNAIAMCNKVLRCAPGRPTTYLKLAKLYAAKGFLAEAKQNFVLYADRMHGAGKIQQAFVALREVTDLSAEGAGLRHMLEDHLKMYGAPARSSEGAPPAPAPPASPDAKEDLHKSGKRKTSSLVFLDLDEPPTRGKAKSPEPPVAAAPSPPPAGTDDLVTEFAPEVDPSLEIQPTSLADDAATGRPMGTVEGLERTADFGDVQASAPSAPSLRDDEPTGDGVELLSDFEATSGAPEAAPSFDSVELDDLEDTIEIAEPAPPPKPPAPPAGRPAPFAPKGPGAPRAPRPPTPAAEPPKVKPVVPKRPAAEEQPKRKPVIEVPPLELEPDFDTEAAGPAQDMEEPPLVLDEAPPTAGRQSGFIDLTLDDEYQGGGAESLAPPGPTIEELEERVADDPDDPDAHRELGEALIETGDRERGIEELDHATAGFENRGELDRAQDLVEEVLHLDPNSVRHRQKQVEFAFKSGDRAKLVDAYLGLADTLLRGDLPEKARAVYQRVAEHEPHNERAKAALAMLAPVAARPPAPKTPAREGRVAARDAKMKVREDAVTDDASSFIDLGAMILDEESVARDTRMKVADEEPTGDEERDFHDMLARFKQGIAENIDEADFQSHYDLGVAFKEMGLLDEAIAEFQKALRAPEGKLRTSEALGACFIEKGAYIVAESILRRGLELPASGDQERVGVLYWLGRALEETGKKVEARDLYGRVVAVDIHFHDVGQRVKALARAK
ncbi:MAG TPA: tetratricopeptide repeat protein [Gemmatimonadales bacterium]|nr:tetratricopeptide repeat protein [Gemmatimonadales bacterium]